MAFFNRCAIQYSSLLREKAKLSLHCKPKLWAAVLPGIHLPDSDTLNLQYDRLPSPSCIAAVILNSLCGGICLILGSILPIFFLF